MPVLRTPARPSADMACIGKPPPHEAGGLYHRCDKDSAKMLYKELRCQLCNRKLAEAIGKYGIAIKCPRCKFLNQFKTVSSK